MKHGYARTSTDAQTTALQLAALKKAGCKTIHRDEGFSGAMRKRPALIKCLAALSAGDVLIVWKLDRLGRSVRDLVNILHDLEQREIGFQSLTEQINTATPTGRMVFHQLAALAEFERGLIAERTRAGVKEAKRRGVKFGRPKRLTAAQVKHARQQVEGGAHPQDVADLLQVSRSTIYRAIR